MKTHCSNSRIPSIFAGSGRNCSIPRSSTTRASCNSGARIRCSADNWRDAYFRVGGITREVESPNQAIEAYHEAQAIWEPLVAAHPDRPGASRRAWPNRTWPSASCRTRFPNLDLDRADELARSSAVRSWSRWRRPIRSKRVTSRAWPTVIRKSPSSEARLQHSGESLVLLEKAKAIEKGLINRYPDKHAYQKSLAEITNVLGYAYYKAGQQRRGAQVVSRGPEHLPDRLEASDSRPQTSLAIELAGAEPFQHRLDSQGKAGARRRAQVVRTIA